MAKNKTVESRRPLIAGNWKMNNTISESMRLVNNLTGKVKAAKDRDIVVCAPATALAVVTTALKGKNIQVGAQNIHWEKSGAYTGEISAPMLTELGVKYAIVGHSERRQYFGETCATVNARAKAALFAGITPIICVGESLEKREKGSYKLVITGQVKRAMADIKKSDAAKCVIAYEPVWAIGTGKTATFEQAEEVCAHIRSVLTKLYDAKTADSVRILYGGSVKPETIDGLMVKPNVDGALVGGAALKSDDFARIVNFVTPEA